MVNNNTKKLVVVLGMHRSGTSTITRILPIFGIGLGDQLMKADEKVNAKGFWEDLDINVLNVEMMKALNTDWRRLAPITKTEVEFLVREGFIERAGILLQQKFGTGTSFGFKDPRVAKLILFWKRVFEKYGYVPNYVVALRNPLSVVQSLTKRDKFFASQSYMMWLDHLLVSLEAIQNESCVAVDYDRLMLTPQSEVQRIADTFNFSVNSKELKNFCENFLDKELRHTANTLEDLKADPQHLPLVADVYKVLLGIAHNKLSFNSFSYQEKLTEWLQEMSRLKPTLVLADQFLHKIGALEHKLAQLRKPSVG